ncbi:MAG: 2Fe-2S iron-sulfur cluster-binding protein [Chloroflexi bacterium]|nr:2Fe-2S iron-sulfur cluster-binding protein [Chloroflexota bacterium]
MAETNGRLVKLTVYRLDPQKDAQATYQDYEIPWVEGLSVMHALNYIYENVDPSLSYYLSCRRGQNLESQESLQHPRGMDQG